MIPAFLPELVLLGGALVLFAISLGNGRAVLARRAVLFVSLATLAASAAALGETSTLFSGAYRVDAFSQVLKLTLSAGFVLVVLAGGRLPDIRVDVHPEYHFFLTTSVTGLVMLVSCVELITLVVALELASFPLYLMVPMRRERPGQRVQMESAIKYILFGVAANGVMFFGMSYLFGLTGTTSIPGIMAKLAGATGASPAGSDALPLGVSPWAIAGLSLMFCGIYYKLAVFPFHFWAPDVYQGASNETAALISSLPKVGAVAVLARFASLAPPEHATLAQVFVLLSAASMFYGNLVALVQTDLKRLLGFSSIAHAGYALLGFVALDADGLRAALYYIAGYLVMILAAFTVASRVSRDGTNVAIQDLSGLHRRSPLLALTLLVSMFALAGVPPFVGFTGKLTLLSAALANGHLTLVILAVLNSAIAIYYYLGVVREAFFRDASDVSPIPLDFPTRLLCVLLVALIVALGVAPEAVLARLSAAVTALGLVGG
ncbi:MAG: NADH-quinone oxidoreductase subunit N [Planctomycetota bacterium]